MMDDLRTKANSPFIKILLAIIMLSFVLTGVAGYVIGGASNNAAEVNGKPITKEQLQQAFQQERQRLQEQLGDNFSKIASDEASMQALRAQVLNNLINDELLFQYANELGLTASDTQVERAIFALPIFQTNGQFDSEKYKQVLSQYNINADNLAAQIRQDLSKAQLANIFGKTELSLPSEIDAYTKLVAQERVVRVATLPLANFVSKVQITDDEIKAYYDEHQEQYIEPEKIQVSYVEIDAASQPKASVTDDEIKAYYEQNLSSYTKSEQRLYSMLQTASQADADAIAAELKNGADFAELVATKSTDQFSKSAKGVIGWMDKDGTPAEITNANLTEKGQVSAPVAVGDNFIIFRLDDIKPESVEPLDSVKDKIRESLLKDKTIKQFYALQQKMSEAATNDNDSLIGVEEVTGVKAKTTDWFDNTRLPAELDQPQVKNEVFSERLVDKNGSTGVNSDVIDINGERAFVIRVTNYKPEEPIALDVVKNQIKETLQTQKALKEMNQDGNRLVAELAKDNSDAAIKALGLQFGEETTISFNTPASAVVETAMAMDKPKADKPTYASTIDGTNNLVIVQLDKVIDGKLTDEEKNQVVGFYQTVVTRSVDEALMNSLRQNAKIEEFVTE